MAHLGHTARLIVSTSNMATSVAAWSVIGFTVTSVDERITRMTDGQLLLSLVEQEFPSPGISYDNAGEQTESTPELIGPDNKTLFFSTYRPLQDSERPSKEQNPALGYIDALVVGVADVPEARQWAEAHGFFVLEEFGDPQPQSDVTDGLATLSFRHGYTGRFLSYTTDIDRDLADDLIASLAEAVGNDVADSTTTLRGVDGRVDTIRLVMPEGTVIMISQDL